MPEGDRGIADILRAAAFAAEKHTGQNRKGASGRPYINHPLEVASTLVSTGGVRDPEVVMAALLHDTVEDCGVSFEELEQMFGRRVSEIVRELTDDNSLPKAERKRLQVEHAPYLSPEARQVKLADKISNIREIGEDPPSDWPVERLREYVAWGESVVDGLRGANPSLEKLFDATAEHSRQLIG
jgi:GTP diphosphokinase / guanosine-3',5'-bis(diphosphate) 3'-diphosphatase